MNYLFETDSFGVSDEGIHYLRNKYNYKTATFLYIDNVEIKKGSSVKNFYTLLLFGIALMCLSLYIGYNIFQSLFFEEGARIYIEAIVASIISSLFGGYCIYSCVKKSIIMMITFENKNDIFDIDTLVKNNQLDEFIIFLNNKLKRNKVIISNLK